ncbi:MAG: 4-alpha-glucanotransferase [Myxococcales bacterium]|nr:4-alpha-glucanotransferase [Myxococcales bacterium]
MARRRIAGVTVPLFSLRSRSDWGVGEIGALAAHAEWLATSGARLVQILPPHELAGGETSPYGARTAFGLDPIYVSLGDVPELDASAVDAALGHDGRAALARAREASAVDYAVVRELKTRALSVAFDRFVERELLRGTARARELEAFARAEAGWLRDYALYVALSGSHGGWGWTTWPEAERDRAGSVLATAESPDPRTPLGRGVLEVYYRQWIAFSQWSEARARLRTLGVELMGDLPFIVGSESADVWASRSMFRRDVSLGAPPDDFSADGQDWGLPAYDFVHHAAESIDFLRARVRHAARLYDRFRIDHVVGLFRMWLWTTESGKKVGRFDPPAEPHQEARGREVLAAIVEEAREARVIAEDLGVIPPFVRSTLAALSVPGYKILPWERNDAFEYHDPKAFSALSVASYSTHDTHPITAWWDELEGWERERLGALARVPESATATQREMALLDLLFGAGSDLALTLAQELTGDRGRVNLPGTVGPHNWTYRLGAPVEALAGDAALAERFARIRSLVELHGRG